ncbi:MAG: AMP-binding protein, partial [Gammaproteobacteria bacterium]|nr:AMP-binding protein [Gammaproteobacteria bacterium]NIT64757.1 AMP-binding protein [Gammaproteobacteria bacterium]NIV21731.1 AMP-binding protein [Gammaproteobacteria bacterium]NIY33337.1 AMP-binding protein [Gammaproteobacteria bacterium]
TRLLLLDSRARWEALLKYRDEFPELRHVICMGPVAEERATGDIRFTFVEQWLPQEGPESFRLQGFDAHNLASIVYTSGTTGRPKGVMLSHHNILWNAEAVMRAVPARAEDVFLSFLPLSHTFERTAGYYVPMMAGSCVAYARSIEGLRADLRTIRPTVLTSVPRIYEAAYSRIRQQLQRRGAIAQRLFHLAVVVGWRCFERAQGRGRPLDVLAAAVWPLFRRLVAQQILERLGGRLRVAISGGAPLPKEIAHTFVGLGLPLLQGYGLTEASPVVSGNRP